MEALLGFPLDAWDYATFVAMAIIGAGFLGLLALFVARLSQLDDQKRPSL